MHTPIIKPDRFGCIAMAGVSSSACRGIPRGYQVPGLNLAKATRKQLQDSPSCIKAKVLLGMMLNMSDCSQESRILLVTMRNQLALALEQERLTTSRCLTSCSSTRDYSSIVNCNNCEGFMVQPVCLPCGHSMCRGCTEKSNVGNSDSLICPSCSLTCSKVPQKNPDSSSPGSSEKVERGACRIPTLTLQNVYHKWYPEWAESCRCREEGNMYANRGDFSSALQCYIQALETGYLSVVHLLYCENSVAVNVRMMAIASAAICV